MTHTHSVTRGGAWISDPRDVVCAVRYHDGPDGRNRSFGFRCIRVSRPIDRRMHRGGAYNSSLYDTTNATRYHLNSSYLLNNVSFRCVRVPRSADEPKHTKRAAYVIPKSGNRVFLLARKKWLDKGTPWIFPGGGLRQNETPVNGAIREFYEETGSKPDRDELKHILTERTKWSDEIHFFLWDTIGYWEASELCAYDRQKFFGWMWLDVTLPNLEKSVIWPTLMPGAQAAIRKLREKGNSI